MLLYNSKVLHLLWVASVCEIVRFVHVCVDLSLVACVGLVIACDLLHILKESITADNSLQFPFPLSCQL